MEKGEWLNEPDKIQLFDEQTGLDCLMVRHERSGHWCGYVGVIEGHPCFGKNYDDVNVDVHGGLTFSDSCQPTESEEKGVCHVPLPGKTDHVWWLGFDCAHSGDLSPSYSFTGETYKDVNSVMDEIKSLALQLSEIKE